jgi:hypothetical protein
MPGPYWDKSFDQGEIEILHFAYARACRVIERDRELAGAACRDAQRLIARRILALAGGGERNPTRLVDDSVSYLRQREQIRRSALRMAAATI